MFILLLETHVTNTKITSKWTTLRTIAIESWIDVTIPEEEPRWLCGVVADELKVRAREQPAPMSKGYTKVRLPHILAKPGRETVEGMVVPLLSDLWAAAAPTSNKTMAAEVEHDQHGCPSPHRRSRTRATLLTTNSHALTECENERALWPRS
jgi:hypothetical protein